MERNADRLVVKIGSSSLFGKDRELDRLFIGNIARQVSEVRALGARVAIVTSGAIASGKNILGGNNGNEVRTQVLAAVGQRPIINAWGEEFDRYGINTGLFLFAESDLDKPRLPLHEALDVDIIPIINANDTVSVDEIRKLAISADNDRLASFVARFLVNANKLILLTEIDGDGVLDSNRQTIGAIDCLDNLQKVAVLGNSVDGTGGMDSKILEARNFISDGSKRAYIASARLDDVIVRIARGESVGTKVTLPLQGYLL